MLPYALFLCFSVEPPCGFYKNKFIYALKKRKVKVKAAQLCLTLCNHMDYIHSILEWVAYPFSSRSSQPSSQAGVSCITGRFFTN